MGSLQKQATKKKKETDNVNGKMGQQQARRKDVEVELLEKWFDVKYNFWAGRHDHVNSSK